jgi:hypothetical protein
MLARCPRAVFDMSNVLGVGSAPMFKFVCHYTKYWDV